MNILPQSNYLPVHNLVSIFDNTSASYKFLLFKAILDVVGDDREEVYFDELALRAISYAWYSIHYYKLNYGYSDKMTKWVKNLDDSFEGKVLIDQKAYHKIYESLVKLRAKDEKIAKTIRTYVKEFEKLVPYRLLSPWFTMELRGQKKHKKNSIIESNSNVVEKQSLYSICSKDEYLKFSFNNDWLDYLKRNKSIVLGWWKFNLLAYLQKNNPTVLSISSKLEPPIARNMDKVKMLYEKFYKFKAVKARCFYSQEEISTISHDHFLPWSFLGSDPIYNFVPSKKEVNSSKSNLIPHEDYLEQFAEFQFEVFEYLRSNEPKSTLIENYINELGVDLAEGKDHFIQKVISFYRPLYLTAQNQGFQYGWKF